MGMKTRFLEVKVQGSTARGKNLGDGGAVPDWPTSSFLEHKAGGPGFLTVARLDLTCHSTRSKIAVQNTSNGLDAKEDTIRLQKHHKETD